jgi:hypothetical protein
MTTLTQADLDDIRRKAEAATVSEWKALEDEEAGPGWDYIVQTRLEDKPQQDGIVASNCSKDDADFIVAVQPQVVLSLLDHIAQLKAERDEARKEFTAAQGQADSNYKRWCDAQARIAELKAQPSAQFVDLVFENGPCPEGARFVEAENPEGKSIRIGEWIAPKEGEKYWRLRLPMSSSAQFVAGMREALTAILYATEIISYRTIDWRTYIKNAQEQARAILAEADKDFSEPASQRAFIRETAAIEGNDIVICVPIDALSTAPNIAWDMHFGAEAEKWKVVDVHLFAKELVSELNRESETGETLITSMLDRAAIEVAEQGGDGIDYAEVDKGCAATESQHG